MIAPVAHLSPYELEAMRFGMLSPERREQAQAHLLGCERCRHDEERAREHREHFARQVHPRTVARLRARAEAIPGAGARVRWVIGLLLSSAAAAAIVLAVVGPRLKTKAEQTILGIKGAPGLTAVARHGDRVFPVTPEVPLAPGDQIRFVLEPGPHRFALVVSIDGGGRASVYHPYQGAESAEVEPERRVEVPGSIVLDGAPGPERIFALYSDRALATAAVARVLREIGDGGPPAIRSRSKLDLPVPAQASVLIEKQVQ